MKNIIVLFSVLLWLSCGISSIKEPKDVTDSYGAVVKRVGVGKTIYFLFSADSLFDGADTILKVLNKHDIKGSFFLTGNCLRMSEHKETIKRVISAGHYVGGHSDCHILYADWDENRTNLVSDDSLQRDLIDNYVELAKFGIKKTDAPYYLPPYEWYNVNNVKAIREWGLVPINFTTGLFTSDDYTTPDMPNYKSSQELMEILMEYESKHSLDGTFVLIHPGTSPGRVDKFYNRLDEIITTLVSKGYTFDKLK